MGERRFFTSESVTEGHPDKVCDAISDAVLDACLEQDPNSRVACETAVTTGLVLIMGEITTQANIDFQKIARDAIREIGYVDGAMGFNANTCAVMVAMDKQSPDIAMGVDKALEARGVANEDDAPIEALENNMTDEEIEAIGVRLRNQPDTGTYALSDRPGTEAVTSAGNGQKERHASVPSSGRKDTGFCRVR